MMLPTFCFTSKDTETFTKALTPYYGFLSSFFERKVFLMIKKKLKANNNYQKLRIVLQVTSRMLFFFILLQSSINFATYAD